MRSLLVEDDAFMGNVLEKALRDRGHDVVRCQDAECAWDVCQREDFPLILSDWMLPGMDGLELCRRIRTLPGGSRSIILIITGLDSPEDLAVALDAGANDYLTKPFTPRLLQVRLAVVERQAAEIAARQAAEAALVAARASAAEAAAWRELIRQQQLMINVISHELRTPLSSIFGFSELLIERDLVPPNLRTELAAIHQGAIRLNNLVDSIVDLSLLESGEASLDHKPTDLGAVVRESAAEFGGPPRIVTTVDPGVPMVIADEVRMRQVVHHLVRNALAFSPADSTVAVRVQCRDEGTVAIEVSNLGDGIPPEELAHVFEPLFRTELAHKRAVQGPGIGLALVRRIAELHGGRATAESSLGLGATFRVVLPIKGHFDGHRGAEHGRRAGDTPAKE